MPGQSDKFDSAANQGSRERDMVAIVANLVRELHPQRSRFIDVDASSRIERDLGIDSLGRTELVRRIEQAFRMRLPAQIIGEAETVHDLAQALERASPTQERVGLGPPAPTLPSVPAATKARTLIEVLEWHVARHPDRTHLTVLQDETTISGTLTYGELAAKALAVGRGLIMRDIVPGDRVALMLPTESNFSSPSLGSSMRARFPCPFTRRCGFRSSRIISAGRPEFCATRAPGF
jgi:acyl carrier protein